jgi:hypothetical protein
MTPVIEIAPARAKGNNDYGSNYRVFGMKSQRMIPLASLKEMITGRS